MLFDESFVVSAAYLFPEVQFHIIGPGRTSSALFAREHSCLREMKFTETVKYISHAKVCIAPYRRDENAKYLADTSDEINAI